MLITSNKTAIADFTQHFIIPAIWSPTEVNRISTGEETKRQTSQRKVVPTWSPETPVSPASSLSGRTDRKTS